MEIVHTVVKKHKFRLIISSLVISFFVFGPISYAAEYGAGLYGVDLYSSSATESDPDARPITRSRVIGNVPTTERNLATSLRFTTNLYYGMRSPDIKLVQRYLNTYGYPVALSGPGSLGQETEFLGAATKAALIKFQIANNILPATGGFGPQTRAFMNKTNINVPVPATQTITVTAINLNVREVAGNGKILGTVSKNSKGIVLDGSSNKNWVKVKFETVVGWVYRAFVQ